MNKKEIILMIIRVILAMLTAANALSTMIILAFEHYFLSVLFIAFTFMWFSILIELINKEED